MANARLETPIVPEVANAMQGHIKRASAQKTIYCPDVATWESYRVLAQEQGVSMSEAIFAGLKLFFTQECPKCALFANILATGSVKPTEVVAEPTTPARKRKGKK